MAVLLLLFSAALEFDIVCLLRVRDPVGRRDRPAAAPAPPQRPRGGGGGGCGGGDSALAPTGVHALEGVHGELLLLLLLLLPQVRLLPLPAPPLLPLPLLLLLLLRPVLVSSSSSSSRRGIPLCVPLAGVVPSPLTGGRPRAGGVPSVDPADGHPLRRGADLLQSPLQDADGLVDVVVDDGQVEEVPVGGLQCVGLAGQLLQAAVKVLDRGERLNGLAFYTVAILVPVDSARAKQLQIF